MKKEEFKQKLSHLRFHTDNTIRGRQLELIWRSIAFVAEILIESMPNEPASSKMEQTGERPVPLPIYPPQPIALRSRKPLSAKK